MTLDISFHSVPFVGERGGSAPNRVVQNESSRGAFHVCFRRFKLWVDRDIKSNTDPVLIYTQR